MPKSFQPDAVQPARPRLPVRVGVYHRKDARVMRSFAEAHEGMTMICVTHEMGFAREVSNRMVFLHQGQIEEQGDQAEVLSRPRSERLRAFLSNSLK